jgi:hypothetical protein
VALPSRKQPTVSVEISRNGKIFKDLQHWQSFFCSEASFLN